MLEAYGATARKSEARARSAGKGKRKAQLSATERAAHVKRFRESGATKSREPVRMGAQGEPARQQHQRSQQHGRGARPAQFLQQAVGSYRGVGGVVQ